MFNESLRKVNEQQPPTIIEEDETPRRANRPPDLTGFSILETAWRSSCSDDSDDSLPVGSYISTSTTPGRFCKSVDFRPLRRTETETTNSCSTLPSTPTNKKNPPIPTMSSGGSRFKSERNLLITDRKMKIFEDESESESTEKVKVVPVETRYKRDRWTCVDFYDNLRDPYFSPNGKHAVAKPTAAIKKEEIINRSSRSLSDIHPASSPSVTQSALPKPIAPFISPNPKPVFTVPKVPTAQVKASTVVQPTPNGEIKVSSQTQITTGLTNGSTTDVPEPRRTKSVTVSPPAHNVANIDNKIEQAMDLVKTHLMFAVREEVDGLRSKIFDLENHVRRLEAENAILKRTIPNDTLKQLHLKL